MADNPYLPERALPAWMSITLLCLAALGFGALVYFGLFVKDQTPEDLKAMAQQTVAKMEDVIPALKPEPTAATETAPAAAETAEQITEPSFPTGSEQQISSGSDDELKALLRENGVADNALSLLAPKDLIRRAVSFTNLVAQGYIDHETGPFAPLGQAFTTDAQSPSIAHSMRRYDRYVQALTAVSPATAAAVYKKIYPLLNSAQKELGEQASYHTRLNQAMNVLISAPQQPIPPALVANTGKAKVWRYANPELEKLPPAQKQLLRMGPDNQRAIAQWLRQFQAAITQAPAAQTAAP